MAKEGSNREISRGEFLRLASGLGGLMLSAPLVQACQRVGMIEPTATPPPAPMDTRLPSPTSTATATPTATASATGTATATSTPTATASPMPRSCARS